MSWIDIQNQEDGLSVREKLNGLGQTVEGLVDLPFPRVLFRIDDADMTSTEDQAYTKIGDFTTCLVLQLIGYKTSATPTGAQGGVYPGPGKTGTPLVGAAQAWSGVIPPRAVVLPLSPLALGTSTADTYYMSLTTPSSVEATCSSFIIGIPLE